MTDEPYRPSESELNAFFKVKSEETRADFFVSSGLASLDQLAQMCWRMYDDGRTEDVLVRHVTWHVSQVVFDPASESISEAQEVVLGTLIDAILLWLDSRFRSPNELAVRTKEFLWHQFVTRLGCRVEPKEETSGPRLFGIAYRLVSMQKTPCAALWGWRKMCPHVYFDFVDAFLAWIIETEWLGDHLETDEMCSKSGYDFFTLFQTPKALSRVMRELTRAGHARALQVAAASSTQDLAERLSQKLASLPRYKPHTGTWPTDPKI